MKFLSFSKTFFPIAVLAVSLMTHLSASAQTSGADARGQQSAVDGSILPFPPTPSASEAGPTIAESSYRTRQTPQRLPDDAPNILIILIDDVGPADPSTYGGEVETPTLSRIARMGVSYNRFHSTAMCSPTRAALLTGRNHTRVSSGQITEVANDFDGFSGVIPKTSATVAEVLRHYGYRTAAFGKWHNTPTTEITTQGPFDNWPTGYGFEYFYGFLAGESSQYEPRLVKNTTYVDPPKSPEEGYHLTEDLADNAIAWLRQQQAFAPGKPFLMYWATGASHGPHQISTEWADKYKGKFDDGWDNYRQRVYQRQKQMGYIPENTILTDRTDSLAAWEDVPEAERPFQRRLMELFAGFSEHADVHAGRIIDELEQSGRLDNTLVFYIWGDNGASAEGLEGTISEMLAQNKIPTTTEQQIAALEAIGGMEVLGSRKTHNMYHAGWAWAGSAPYKGTKLLASHFGGTRQPMAVSWPKQIQGDATPRPQFHHVVDVVPTIYDIVVINPPQLVNGQPQNEFDGVSMVYSFNDPSVEGRRRTQFFDIMGSRGIYHDGWFACTFGPRVPWIAYTPGIDTWTPEQDVWELYNLDEDWSQANDLADQMPEKLASLKDLFLVESVKNKNLPIGGGLYAVLHPEVVADAGIDQWTFLPGADRMQEVAAPRIGARDNRVTLQVDLPDSASGVLFAVGDFAGGLTCYLDDGHVVYEYNLFLMQRTKIRSEQKLAAGLRTIAVELQTKPAKGAFQHLNGGDIEIRVDDAQVARGEIPVLIDYVFTANGTLDFGADHAPVSEEYYDKSPFQLSGELLEARVEYVQ